MDKYAVVRIDLLVNKQNLKNLGPSGWKKWLINQIETDDRLTDELFAACIAGQTPDHHR